MDMEHVGHSSVAWTGMRDLGLRSVSVLVYRFRNAPYDLSRNNSGLPALDESRCNFLSVITYM